MIKNIEKLYLFTIIFLFSGGYSTNLKLGEIMYLGRGVKTQSVLSSYIGESHLLLFNFLTNILSILEINPKVVFNIVACIWLLLILLKAKSIFQIDQKGLLILLLLLLNVQSFFAAEFFFGSIEGKVFSYLSLFSSFLYAFNGKLLKSFSLYTMSIFFHASVAIVSFPVLLIILYQNFSLHKIIKTGFPFFVICTPYLYYLLDTNFNSTLTPLKKKELMEFLIAYRLPHHLFPFSDDNTNIFHINDQWVPGFIFMLVLSFSFFILFFVNNRKTTITHQLNKIILLTLSIFWIFVITVSFIPISSFVLAYPFRITSSIVFLSYIFVALKRNELDFMYKKELENIFLSMLIIFSSNSFLKTIEANVDSVYTNSQIEKTLIEQNPEIIFLPLYDESSKNSYLNAIEYNTSIPTYASYKLNVFFIKDVEEWKNRLNNLKIFFDGNCQVFDEFENYIFIDNKSNNECGSFVEKVGPYYLYRKLS
jgi:hypothetical protein